MKLLLEGEGRREGGENKEGEKTVKGRKGKNVVIRPGTSVLLRSEQRVGARWVAGAASSPHV
jgi:hypothetical protein